MQQDADALDVAAYLRAHPQFLAANPDLYATLAPPRRVHGAVLADHMQAMLVEARSSAASAQRAGSDAAAGRRAAESFVRRVQEAVVALMRIPDAAWFVSHDLAGLLRVDAALLNTEREPLPVGAMPIPPGTVASVLGQRSAVVQARAVRLRALHGEAAALASQEALVRVPLRAGDALLALACRDGQGLQGATTDTLGFLGQAVAAALDR